MMTGKQLKNAILQLAIQGKLVPQDPTDEPASALLARIRKEKEQLVKAGKLKKKDLETTPISDEEKPFEIPESWEWVRLGEISNLSRGRSQHRPRNDKSLFIGGYIPFIQTGDVANAITHISTCKTFYNEKGLSQSKLWNKGTLCMTIAANIGDVAILDFDACFPDSVVGLKCYFPVENNLFFLYGLMSYKNILDEMSYSTAQKNINIDILQNLVFPLPPLAEQHRIVSKIEELMPLVEEYGAAQEKLNRLNEVLPEALKKSILQQAIQGKLVPQDPADEPASVLLAKIRKEKEQLVKAGKLKKKDLATTPITDEEKPFEIPESWEWVRLGDIFSHNNGKQLNRADTKGKLHDYITTSNLYWDNFDLKEVRQMLFTEDELVRCTATKGDLLVCEGGDVGRSAIWDKDYDICIQNHIHRLRAYSPLCTRYFLYLLMFNKSIGLIGGKGIGIQGLSATALHSIPVALPPLAEQRRIVAKVEELFAVVEGMEGEKIIEKL